jgi:hypothetical protein
MDGGEVPGCMSVLHGILLPSIYLHASASVALVSLSSHEKCPSVWQKGDQLWAFLGQFALYFSSIWFSGVT